MNDELVELAEAFDVAIDALEEKFPDGRFPPDITARIQVLIDMMVEFNTDVGRMNPAR